MFNALKTSVRKEEGFVEAYVDSTPKSIASIMNRFQFHLTEVDEQFVLHHVFDWLGQNKRAVA